MQKCKLDFTLRMSFFLCSWLVVMRFYITLFVDTTYFMLWWTQNDIPSNVMNMGINLLKLCNIKQETDKNIQQMIFYKLRKMLYIAIFFKCLVCLCITVSMFHRLCFVVLFMDYRNDVVLVTVQSGAINQLCHTNCRTSHKICKL